MEMVWLVWYNQRTYGIRLKCMKTPTTDATSSQLLPSILLLSSKSSKSHEKREDCHTTMGSSQAGNLLQKTVENLI